MPYTRSLVVYISARLWPSANKMLVYSIRVSQGSVATRLRCGGIFQWTFIANFPQSVSVKEWVQCICTSCKLRKWLASEKRWMKTALACPSVLVAERWHNACRWKVTCIGLWKEVKKAALVGLWPYMPLQSGTKPRLTTSQPVYLLVVQPVTAPEKEWAKPLVVGCLLTRCLVPVCGVCGAGGNLFVTCC